MFDYRQVSPGEKLCRFLYETTLDPRAWERLQERHLANMDSEGNFQTYFRELLAINMTRRLILVGAFAKRTLLPSESGYLALLSNGIANCGLTRLDRDGRLSRLVRDSVVAANHGISDSLRDAMVSWSKREHPHCYLCGRSLNFDAGPVKRCHDMTLDHIWPQSHGGDSDEENLLPACRDCNSRGKQDYPSWAGCDVQMLTIGRDPSAEELKICKRFRFALHGRQARLLACEHRLTLKRAYIRLKPWKETPRLMDEEDVGYFFNLEIHQQ